MMQLLHVKIILSAKNDKSVDKGRQTLKNTMGQVTQCSTIHNS